MSAPGRVFDVTALGAAAAGSIYIGSLLRVSLDLGIPLVVPATALAEALHAAGNDSYRLEFLVSLPTVEVHALDLAAAEAVARLMARATVGLAVAHTAWVALDRDWPVVTAEPALLRALHPALRVEQLP